MESNRSKFQLSLRTLLEIVAVVAIVLAIAYQRFGGDHYRLVVTELGPGNGPPAIHLYDSTTGQVWELRYGTKTSTWVAYPPPPVAGK